MNTRTRRRFVRISSFLLFSLFFSLFHVYKVLTAIFIPAKNRRNSRHDHIRDHRFLKLHPLNNAFGLLLVKFLRFSSLENRLFYVFLNFSEFTAMHFLQTTEVQSSHCRIFQRPFICLSS